MPPVFYPDAQVEQVSGYASQTANSSINKVLGSEALFIPPALPDFQ